MRIAILTLLLSGCSLLENTTERTVRLESHCADGSSCICEGITNKTDKGTHIKVK